jgi:hypothetical protein
VPSADLEQEELRFHAGVHHEAQIGRRRDLPLEHLPRVAGERRPSGMWMSQISRATRSRASPHGNTRKVEWSGDEQHVRLLDPHEPLDRRPVEEDVARQRLLELRARDLDVLVDAEDVGELQAQETGPDAPRRARGCRRWWHR